MGLNITQDQYRTVFQTVQDRYVKLELLNYQFQTVDELSGVAIDGTINIDATADVRRTGNIQIAVNNSTFEVQSGGKIWLDRFIRVWIGTRSILSGEISWTNCGIYIIDAPSYSYDHATNTLSLSLLDLMAKFTGIRNGYLKGTAVVFKAGENIRKAIIDTLALGGFTKYVVEEAPSPGVIPNDLEFGQGSTVYDLLSGLRDIYPNYEMFFDVNGTFFYKKIPDGVGDPVMVRDDIWDTVVLSENIETDFQNVKNSIEVYGRIHDPAYFSTNTTLSGSTINLTIAGTNYVEDAIYGFTLTNNTGINNVQIKVNNSTLYSVKNDDGTAASIKAEKGEIFYCVQFKKDHWRWLGHLQSYGFAEDTNAQSPYYVEGPVGRIRLPLYDGEYANCITDDLAQQRAEYELWMHTNLNDAVSLSIIPVPWLDVNILVERTLARNKEKHLYIIKNISFGLSPNATGTVNMIRFYPELLENIKERN